MLNRRNQFKGISIISFLICMTISACTYSVESNVEKYDSSIGELEFHNGFEKGLPTEATTKKLIEAYDLSYATTAYAWALPMVATEGMFNIIRDVHKASYGDIVSFDGLDNIRPFLTSNNSTPYFFSVVDLSKTGPMVLDIPAGKIMGGVNDAWQRPVVDLGMIGIGAGRGEKTVLTGPGQHIDASGYNHAVSKTNKVFIFYRAIEREDAEGLLQGLKHYPFYDRLSRPASKVIVAKGSHDQRESQPRGLAYWERLHNAMESEVVEERDRLFYGMLKPLGLEKGKPFKPTKEQKAILEQASFLGESMAKAYTFDKRFESRVWREGSHWENLVNLNPNQVAEHSDNFEERAAFFYEATTMSETYTAKFIGVGSKYVFAYKDQGDKWLDGAQNYTLEIPADVPAQDFWDVSVYESNARVYLTNKTNVVNLGSRDEGLVRNEDGTVTMYFGPKAPKGKEANWIQTVPGENWFACFRFYGPLEGYYDGTFTLADIQKQ